MENLKKCPHCGSRLSGMFTTSNIRSAETTEFINKYSNNTSEAYCSDFSCAQKIIQEISYQFTQEKDQILKEVKPKLKDIPIVTTHTPYGWDYDILGIISAQSVTGTGIFSEISSAWADVIGGQSNSLSAKIAQGESICKDKLRYDCLLMGGNAIIATDIDYSEVGGGKGMLMVCMAGTAIKFKSYPSTLANSAEMFDELGLKAARIQEINAIKYPKSETTYS